MDTKEIFDQMAARYDTPDRVDVVKIIARAVRDELKDTGSKRALDYGCGTGLLGFELLDLFDSMLFVDTSPKMVDQVRKKLDEARISKADTLCCDFCAALPSGIKTDYVVMSNVLLHVKNYRLLLERLYQLLSPGGRLILVDFDKNERISSDMVHNGFEQAELTLLLRDIGFSSAEARTFYHGQRIFMNEDASVFILSAGK